MSLIADSLKKALKTKEGNDPSQAEFNLVPKKKGIFDGKIKTITRFFIFIAIPVTVLSYLIYTGVFDRNKMGFFELLPIWKKLGINISPRISPPVQVTQAPPSPVTIPSPPLPVATIPKSPLKPKEPTPVQEEPDPPSKTLEVLVLEEPERLAPSKPKLKGQPDVPKADQLIVSEFVPPLDSVETVPPPLPLPDETMEAIRKGPSIEQKITVKRKPRIAVKRFQKDDAVIDDPSIEQKITVKRKPRIAVKRLQKDDGIIDDPSVFLHKDSPEVRIKKQHFVLMKSPSQVEPTQQIKSSGLNPKQPTSDKSRALHAPKGHSSSLLLNSDYYFNMGYFYQESGEYEKALASYQQSVELDPDNPEVHNNIGLIYKELKWYDEALRQFMRVVFMDPTYVKAYNNIGVIYYLKGNLKGALANYQKALAINPNNIETYNNLGVIYKKQRWLEKAVSVYNRALKIDSKHPGTNYNLALLHEEMDNFESALYFYHRFLEFGSDNHPILVNRVRSHIEWLKKIR